MANSGWDATCIETLLGTTCTRPPIGQNDASLDSSGPRLGGYFGYNWQVAPQALLGIEGDAGWGATKAALTGGFPGLGGAPNTSLNDHGYVTTGWDASIRGRAGLFPAAGLLLYATGGVAFQEFGFDASCPAEGGNWCNYAHSETNSAVRVGYTVGGGIEKSFGFSSAGLSNDGPWRVRLEYRFSDYGGLTHDFFSNTVDVLGARAPLQTNTI